MIRLIRDVLPLKILEKRFHSGSLSLHFFLFFFFFILASSFPGFILPIYESKNLGTRFHIFVYISHLLCHYTYYTYVVPQSSRFCRQYEQEGNRNRREMNECRRPQRLA